MSMPAACEPALKSLIAPILRAAKSRSNWCGRAGVRSAEDRSCGQMSFAISSIGCFVYSSSRSGALQVVALRGVGCFGVRGASNLGSKSLLKRDFCLKDGEIQDRELKCQAGGVAAMTSALGSPPVGYRPNVGVCLVNDKNEVWVGSRLDLPDSWQMPQGGVDEGEDPQQAAIRELREETGVTSAQLIGEVAEWLTYDFPPDVKAKITRLWGKPWTGQAQKWFLFRFTGDDSEVNLAGDGTEPAEFANWKWLPAEDVIKMVVDFKKPVYSKAFKSLAVFVDSWSKL
ncbi:hypothetical protein Mapa_000646 [Marchantia paleacea]|nr:hypothetical protein Mapa_000646 [Marchantia paleacea]